MVGGNGHLTKCRWSVCGSQATHTIKTRCSRRTSPRVAGSDPPTGAGQLPPKPDTTAARAISGQAEWAHVHVLVNPMLSHACGYASATVALQPLPQTGDAAPMGACARVRALRDKTSDVWEAESPSKCCGVVTWVEPLIRSAYFGHRLRPQCLCRRNRLGQPRTFISSRLFPPEHPQIKSCA